MYRRRGTCQYNPESMPLWDHCDVIQHWAAARVIADPPAPAANDTLVRMADAIHQK